MKPVDIKSNIYIDFRSEINDKNQKIKIADNVRISKYKKVFKKGYSPNRSGEGFVTKKLKTLFRGHLLPIILMVKNLLKPFMKINCKNQIKKNLEFLKSNQEKRRWIIC